METKLNTVMSRYLLFFMLMLFSFISKANNVVITNITVTPYNNYCFQDLVQINFSYENSYKSDYQEDGIYFFLKVKNIYGVWTSINNFLIESPGCFYNNVNIQNVGTGVLIKRSTNGQGTFTDYFIIATSLPADCDLRVFAVEMVNIKFLFTNYGDGNGVNESLNAFHNSTDNTVSTGSILSVDINTFDDTEVEGANSITLGSPLGISNAAINNPKFPVGGTNLWVMKYEISQAAYRDFLNTLTLTQQTTRTTNPPTSPIGLGALTSSGMNRNYLEIKIPSNGTDPAVYGCDADGDNIFDEAADGEYIACNFLSWMDVAAYLDWAGLAPMTETQYELACNYHKAYYYEDKAWGLTLNNNALTLINPGGGNEGISNASSTLGNANFVSSGINGPLRNGIFSTATSDTRKKSGATYFGAMEMSGNLYEPCVTVGNVAGRSFNKTQTLELSRGDGTLAPNGNALVSYWPGNVSSASSETVANAEVTTAAGTIRRGGSWNSPAPELRKADRSQGEVPTTRTATQGGRGVLNL